MNMTKNEVDAKVARIASKIIAADDHDVNRKLEWIKARLGEGYTVSLTTMLRSTPITPKIWEKWQASGKPLLKASNGVLWMWQGGRYVDANYCSISIKK